MEMLRFDLIFYFILLFQAMQMLKCIYFIYKQSRAQLDFFFTFILYILNDEDAQIFILTNQIKAPGRRVARIKCYKSDSNSQLYV